MAALDTYATGYAESRERFEHETRHHEMSILRDDGLYRHVRFRAPDSGFYWYDLVTWPGYLAIVGDAGDWVFTRTRDMFEFFALDGRTINPGYWAQKLVAPRSGAKVYSHEALRARVLEWAHEECEDRWAGWGSDYLVYPSLLHGALEIEVLYDWTHSEHEGRERIDILEQEVGHMDAWEWDLRSYDWSFLWCCWAIARGIARYREAGLAEEVPARA